jgi:hypothetical protein
LNDWLALIVEVLRRQILRQRKYATPDVPLQHNFHQSSLVRIIIGDSSQDDVLIGKNASSIVANFK